MPVYYSNQEIPGSPDSRFGRKSSDISKRGHEENLAGDPDTNHTLAEQEEFPGECRALPLLPAIPRRIIADEDGNGP
jgi:hypothetical protein